MVRGTPPLTTCQLASHVAIKMTSNVLNTYWPLLKVLQFLGACPIQKDGDSPCGFKALTFLAHLTRVLLASLLGISIYTGIFAYLYSIEGISITDVNEIIFHFSGLSEMDSALMFALQASITSVCIFILIGNFTFKNQFIELMQLFASLKISQQSCGRKFFLIFIIMSWLVSIFGVIPTSVLAHSFDLKTKVLVTIAILSLSVISNSQIIGFLIFYGDAGSQLDNWIKNIIQKIESKQQYESETIEECSKLLKEGLKKTNSIFSSFLFWISTLYLTALIFTAYLTMVFSSHAFNSMDIAILNKIVEIRTNLYYQDMKAHSIG